VDLVIPNFQPFQKFCTCTLFSAGETYLDSYDYVEDHSNSEVIGILQSADGSDFEDETQNKN
jgi:hypothetical protein